MSGLQWIRLDTTFPTNHKIMELVDNKQHRVVVAHVSMMCHVGLLGTDGFFPETALKRYGITKKDAVAAVKSGLWNDVSGGGFTINNWDKYQVADPAAQARTVRARHAAQARWDAGKGDEHE